MGDIDMPPASRVRKMSSKENISTYNFINLCNETLIGNQG
jgi:hypothetical protein